MATGNSGDGAGARVATVLSLLVGLGGIGFGISSIQNERIEDVKEDGADHASLDGHVSAMQTYTSLNVRVETLQGQAADLTARLRQLELYSARQYELLKYLEHRKCGSSLSGPPPSPQ